MNNFTATLERMTVVQLLFSAVFSFALFILILLVTRYLYLKSLKNSYQEPVRYNTFKPSTRSIEQRDFNDGIKSIILVAAILVVVIYLTINH